MAIPSKVALEKVQLSVWLCMALPIKVATGKVRVWLAVYGPPHGSCDREGAFLGGCVWPHPLKLRLKRCILGWLCMALPIKAATEKVHFGILMYGPLH